MDESIVLSLIADGEGRSIEFKRELDLNSARNKAEFIKDIISLANSSPTVGYLLIGVNDNKYIEGINKINEEQIQHIAKTYITPSLNLHCSIAAIEAPTLPLVGIIEVTATYKPHKVAKSIEQLNQDDIFVRHGSIVVKASPEEIIRMHNGTGENYRNESGPKLSITEEKAARMKRVRLFNYVPNYSWEDREKDLEWLKSNTDGYELGEVLYWEVEGWESRYEEEVGLLSKPLLDKAIRLGYRTPDVYFLRAEANMALYNYGLALLDINEAIALSRPFDHGHVKYLAYKANILVEMNKIEEAIKVIEVGKSLDNEELRCWLSFMGYSFEDNLLCRFVLEHKYGDNSSISKSLHTAANILALYKGRQIRTLTKWSNGKLKIETDLDDLSKKIPGNTRAFREIMGEKLWQALFNDTKIILDLQLSTMPPQQLMEARAARIAPWQLWRIER
jgi:tetratricopeptide (TPR) repeat protein